MGMNEKHLEFLEIALKSMDKKLWSGVKMLELGDQCFYKNGKWGISGKQYFEKLGVNHVSIDINGKNRALKKDLRFPIQDIGEPFDIVTNFGTIEHVEGNQYQPFKTMHDLVKAGGILTSIAPGMKYNDNHSRNKYKPVFFEVLAIKNSYDIVKIHEFENKIIAIYRKINNDSFITEFDFKLITGLVKQ